MPTTHLLITGRVQGVFFRATAKDVADELGLRGWVRNTDDAVEAMVTGDEKTVEKFVEWCRHGPRKAVVADVTVTPQPEMHFPDFAIKR